MKVTLEEHTNPLHIGRYAGICYGREGNNEKRIKHIIDVGHLSCLRFSMAVFKVSGVSRVCLAQLTRSKFLDYLVRGSRYCDESGCELLTPETLGNKSLPLSVKERIMSFKAEIEQLLQTVAPIIFGDGDALQK